MKGWIAIYKLVLCGAIIVSTIILTKEKEYQYKKAQEFVERNRIIDSIRNIELKNIYPIK